MKIFEIKTFLRSKGYYQKKSHLSTVKMAINGILHNKCWKGYGKIEVNADSLLIRMHINVAFIKITLDILQKFINRTII